MIASNPYELLNKTRRKYQQILVVVLLALVLLSIWVYLTIKVSPGVLIFFMVLAGLGMVNLYKKNLPDLNTIIQLVHQQNPKLEYSGDLFLHRPAEGSLAALQLKRIEKEFYNYHFDIGIPKSFLVHSTFLLVLFFVAVIGTQHLSFARNKRDNSNHLAVGAITPDGLLVDTSYLTGFQITVEPPGYTGLKRRTLSEAQAIEIVEGSMLTWKLEIQGSYEKAYFIFGSEDTVMLEGGLTHSKRIYESVFYKFGFTEDGRDSVSDYITIKVKPDNYPEVRITGIEEYIRLPWGKHYDIEFDINMSDDYTLSRAYISATVAKGSGEAVKFREKQFEISSFRNGIRTFKGSHQFSTNDLEMEPGDELYFYVRVRDNCPYQEHWTKSLTHFVMIEDTSKVELTTSSGMQVDVLPEFFRSQRQIIIDSEQLLKDRSMISKDSFNRASNALGYDQKMLRLKYGQFLGEESESGIDMPNEVPGEEVHDHDDDHDHEEEGASGALESARELISEFQHNHDHEEEENELLSTKGTERKADPSMPTWVEALSHSHDDSEAATFHHMSVKSKLKAALSEMWDAELHLRLYDPASSLPYQYKSLALLQEIKNHARIYVHKVGFDAPAIKEKERRLKGDQSAIQRPSRELEIQVTDEYAVIKQTIKELGIPQYQNARKSVESAIESIAGLALDRPELIPILQSLQQFIRLRQLKTRGELEAVRQTLLKVVPEGEREVTNPLIYTHALSREIAKKMNS